MQRLVQSQLWAAMIRGAAWTGWSLCTKNNSTMLKNLSDDCLLYLTHHFKVLLSGQVVVGLVAVWSLARYFETSHCHASTTPAATSPLEVHSPERLPFPHLHRHSKRSFAFARFAPRSQCRALPPARGKSIGEASGHAYSTGGRYAWPSWASIAETCSTRSFSSAVGSGPCICPEPQRSFESTPARCLYKVQISTRG